MRHFSCDSRLSLQKFGDWLLDVQNLTIYCANTFRQKLMALKHLTLLQSWRFFSLRVSLFGCNVARAFSHAYSFDLIFCPYLGIKLVS